MDAEIVKYLIQEVVLDLTNTLIEQLKCGKLNIDELMTPFDELKLGDENKSKIRESTIELIDTINTRLKFEQKETKVKKTVAFLNNNGLGFLRVTDMEEALSLVNNLVEVETPDVLKSVGLKIFMEPLNCEYSRLDILDDRCGLNKTKAEFNGNILFMKVDTEGNMLSITHGLADFLSSCVQDAASINFFNTFVIKLSSF